MEQRLLLLTPPFTQINTPYPATGVLTAFLRQEGHQVEQRDLGLKVALRLFSRAGLKEVFQRIRSLEPKVLKKRVGSQFEVVQFFLATEQVYLNTIDPVICFLQGQDDSLALRISNRRWLPEGPRFQPLHQHQELIESFGPLGLRDQAKYLASLYLDDCADLVKICLDSDFELSRYGEKMASSQPSFSRLYERLNESSTTLIDQWIQEETLSLLREINPTAVGFTCPFPGNLYGALKTAQVAKTHNPKIKTLLGGGFVNTELRCLEDTRFFEFMDFLTFDDGEIPLARLLEFFDGRKPKSGLVRTMWCENGQVVYQKGSNENTPFKNAPTPTQDGLDLHRYVSMMEMPNPMHRLWSDFRWNKLALAHGCYWKKCTFCDVSLDYIQRFEPARVENLVSQMRSMAKESGTRGFHFVDEAAPPALLNALSDRLIEENESFVWWGNLRFDKQFTPDVAQRMSEAGCVAVTGGLEVASPRLLELINKGVSIEQVARVTKAFVDAGVFVHAYLMYGFPSQTEQETIDSLEVVRQLFQEGCLHSAHWHRFVVTEHSPIGKNPADFGIELRPAKRPSSGWFARNAIEFVDPQGADHEALGAGLRRALYNYMHGIGLDQPVHLWFDRPVLKTSLAKNLIRRAVKNRTTQEKVTGT